MHGGQILVNELQLGSQLGQAVKQQRNADFALLLSMMSQNVLDHAEFCLPSDSPAADTMDEARLRQTLGLAPAIPFSANDNSVNQSLMLGIDLHSEGLAEVKLNGYLNPEPLALVDDVKAIPDVVLTNCELTVLTRHRLGEVRISESLDADNTKLYELLEDIAA